MELVVLGRANDDYSMYSHHRRSWWICGPTMELSIGKELIMCNQAVCYCHVWPITSTRLCAMFERAHHTAPSQAYNANRPQ